MGKKGKQKKGISRRDFIGGVVGGSVATLAMGDLAGGFVEPKGKTKEAQKVRFSRTHVPVLRKADVVIVGGSFAAIAAAAEFAQAGRKVVLVESRTYLGREMTATLRPWINLGRLATKKDLPGPIKACLDAAGAEVVGGDIAFKPDTVKRALEDILLNKGVDLIYASHPISVLVEDGAIYGVVIGNKSGRQAVVGKVVIDATETAVVARIAGAEFEPVKSDMFSFKRTLELDGVGGLGRKNLSVPESIGIAGNKVEFYRGKGPVYVECTMDLHRVFALGEKLDLTRLMGEEIEARRRSARLVSYLANNTGVFRNAHWAAGSNELHGRHTTRLAGPAPKWALDYDAADVEFTDKQLRDVNVTMSKFAGPVRNLWCLQEAARLESSEMMLFEEPVSAALLGEAFGKALASQWDKIISVVSKKSERGTVDLASDGKVKEQESPQRGRTYEQAFVGSMEVPVLRTCDVLMVGGGTSGAISAITSAYEGMRTVLLELNPGLGGTGTLGGVDSYWFGRRVGFNRRVKQLVDTEHKAVNYKEDKAWPTWNIEAKMYALLKEAGQAGVEVFFNAVTIGTVVDGNRVRGVVAASKFGVFAVLAKVVIDATGDGDVAAFAGAEYTYGSTRDHVVMWYSLAQFVKPGRTQNNFTSMVDVSNIEDYTRAIIVGRRRGGDLHDHGIYIASRETRHIKGGVVLTLTDELRRRQWPDVVNIHYSNCDLKGKTASDWFRIGLIPPNMEVEIPYRALLPEGLEGILVAGKAISANHDGLPAIRMQADLENLGGVVALAAAQAVREGVPPRQINLAKLQKTLVEKEVLPKEILERKVEEHPYSDAELKALVGSIKADKPLYAYSIMEMGEVFREKIPMVEVCGGNCARAAPILAEVLSSADEKLRVRLAQALAKCGSAAGAAALIAEIERHLAEGRLPVRTSKVLYTQLPPDQGAMPDVVYLIYSLWMTRDKGVLAVLGKVAELLAPTEEDFRDRLKGTFYYVDSVCYGAELLGDAQAIPILQKLHSYGPLRNLVMTGEFNPDFVHERRAMLEIAIGRALARCSSADGYAVLISYLDDNRALLAEGAHSGLASISGQDYGKDARRWKSWLAEAKDSLKPCPLGERLEG
jgi:ribulose 1,5-bisphosphate synthetase/thiazole synthase